MKVFTETLMTLMLIIALLSITVLGSVFAVETIKQLFR